MKTFITKVSSKKLKLILFAMFSTVVIPYDLFMISGKGSKY